MELVLLKNSLKRLKTLPQSSLHKSNHKAGCHPRSNNRAPFHDPKTSRSQTRPNWSENSRTARTSTLISRHRCCSLTKELPSSASLVIWYDVSFGQNRTDRPADRVAAQIVMRQAGDETKRGTGAPGSPDASLNCRRPSRRRAALAPAPECRADR